MHRRQLLAVGAAAVTAPAFLASARAAEAGVGTDEVVFGHTGVLTGPLGGPVKAMLAGAELAFADSRASGGVHGRAIKLVSLDDELQPPKAVANYEKLLADGVFAFFGCVGSPAYPKNVEDTDPTRRYPGLLETGSSCGSEITPLTANHGQVISAIEKLSAVGETYIPAGMAWGLGILLGLVALLLASRGIKRDEMWGIIVGTSLLAPTSTSVPIGRRWRTPPRTVESWASTSNCSPVARDTSLARSRPTLASAKSSGSHRPRSICSKARAMTGVSCCTARSRLLESAAMAACSTVSCIGPG